MKKTGAFLFLAALLLIPLKVYGIEASAGVGVTILDAQGPSINFSAFVNNSGIPSRNFSLSFFFSESSGMSNCRMFIDHQINYTNNTLSNDVPSGNFTNFNMTFKLFDIAPGEFNFSVNCTDSLGFNSSSEVIKFVTIPMDEFDGRTTDITKADVRNITNFVVEKSGFGTINFSDYIDLSSGLDLDSFINMTSNKVQLDSHILKELNKSATLYLHNLAFTNPRVVRDGVACPADICTEISYSGGTFIFNVSHFSEYSSEETPSGTTTTTTGGGGGGGGEGGGGGGGSGPLAIKREFTLSKETLKVVLKQGQIKEETFTIKNTGDVTLAIEVDPRNLKNFITFQDIGIGRLVLLPGQEQAITSVFEAHEDQKPDIYPGEIIFKGESVEKKLLTVVEVDSASPLFDADVQVLPQYKSILPGNDIVIEVSLFNVRGFGRVDVNLEYSISDFQGNLIATEHETVAVETQAKFSRELPVPADIEPGTYIASVKVTFENSVGISSDLFEVRAKAIRLIPVQIINLAPYLISIVVVALIAYLFVIPKLGLRGKKQIPKTKEEESREESKLLKTEEKIKKLEKELAASKSAYKSGFISEESYKNNKARVEKELDKLRKE